LGDVVSAQGRIGRSSLQDSYVEALLTTKIIVTAQRTGWEDHYRLFEAIIGGGLVLTDPMYTMPLGYTHGENIIIYHSLDELKHYITYYLEHPQERLAIARKGWQLAMEQHRTYHWMERIFFGTPLTP
jgi:spore maturation protein CgeB